jgi:hypothetical protein
MANKPSILIDINVLLDVLQKREPFITHLLNCWLRWKRDELKDLLLRTV